MTCRSGESVSQDHAGPRPSRSSSIGSDTTTCPRDEWRFSEVCRANTCCPMPSNAVALPCCGAEVEALAARRRRPTTSSD